eukprot:60297-Hanusia_phi.AAC.3
MLLLASVLCPLPCRGLIAPQPRLVLRHVIRSVDSTVQSTVREGGEVAVLTLSRSGGCAKTPSYQTCEEEEEDSKGGGDMNATVADNIAGAIRCQSSRTRFTQSNARMERGGGGG